MERIRPKGTTVMILPEKEQEAVTKSGIILPDTQKKLVATFRKGVVIDKGTGDQFNPMTEIKKNDIIYFSRKSGVPVKTLNDKGDEVEYLLVPYDKCIGVL